MERGTLTGAFWVYSDAPGRGWRWLVAMDGGRWSDRPGKGKPLQAQRTEKGPVHAGLK